MNVIFLDIDGVLNSDEYFKEVRGQSGFVEIDKNTLPILKQIVEENNAVLVLSSTWRCLDDPEYPSGYAMWINLINALASVGLGLYDKTPYLFRTHFDENCEPINLLDLPEETPVNTRPLEIKAWLDEHPDVKAWISIEDDYAEEHYKTSGIPGHLLQTSFWGPKEECGLQKHHVEIAREMFDKQKFPKAEQFVV